MLDQEMVIEAIRAATEEVFATMLGAAIDFNENAKADPDGEGVCSPVEPDTEGRNLCERSRSQL